MSKLTQQVTITLDTKITFDEVMIIFNKFAKFRGRYCDQEVIGPCIPELREKKGNIFIVVSMPYIAPFKAGQYTICPHEFVINRFPGQISVRDLPLTPIFDLAEEDEFIMRGLKFEELVSGTKYKHASGFMYVKTWNGYTRLPINSRVVVDPTGYQRYTSADRWYQNDVLSYVPENMFQSTLPTVPVYSLEYRKWGEIPLDQITDINFDETAFDRVILPPDYRKIVHNLVTNFYKTDCTDFIAGKKRGLVFLLNGNPGTGKTLTAQAVAELTHSPLYSVGSGDLGTNPEEIEKNLKNIFNMVSLWNGIVLIDEADVFMSKRTDHDIVYNACVSVFLRLVESYYGILFLTTNRDHNIDPAFDSRIHIKLKYHDLKNHGRSQVWEESLKRYNIAGIDINKLCQFKLNNREIANIVQLAYIQTGGNPENVTFENLQDFVNLRLKFDK